MKNIEEMLQSVKPTSPRRSLDTSFTHNVLESIESNNKGNIFMKISKKPLMAALSIAFVFASGITTYAAITNWPAVSSKIVSEQATESGGRIVRIDTENCKPLGDKTESTQTTKYYEVKKDSVLTNEKILALVQGNCEQERTSKVVSRYFSKASGGNIYESSGVKITAITDDSISVTSISKDADPNPKTYSNVARDIKVTDGSKDLTYADLKVGDSVDLMIDNLSGIQNERGGSYADISKQQVVLIIKTPEFTQDPSSYDKYVGSEFVRVEPKKDGNGFDRVYPFNDEANKSLK